MAQEHGSKTTTDHDEIKHWVEEREGKPTRAKGTEILRIDFNYNGKDEGLEEISWEEFFDQFEKNKLAFLYQEKLANGKESNFSKFVAR